MTLWTCPVQSKPFRFRPFIFVLSTATNGCEGTVTFSTTHLGIFLMLIGVFQNFSPTSSFQPVFIRSVSRLQTIIFRLPKDEKNAILVVKGNGRDQTSEKKIVCEEKKSGVRSKWLRLEESLLVGAVVKMRWKKQLLQRHWRIRISNCLLEKQKGNII